MTPSPSICRLDERSLVRSRRALIERQASPADGGSGNRKSRRGESVGSMNWEALNEVRNGRGTSSLVGLTSRRVGGAESCSGIESRLDTGSGFKDGSSSGVRVASPIQSGGPVFRPRWPFAEPSLSESSLTPEPGAGGGLSIISRLTARAVGVGPPPVQVLGNVPSARDATRPASRTMDVDDVPDLSGIVAERLSTLTAALRESDVAHSTKASGLGQLVASTQDHIIQAVEESSKVSTQEHAVTIGHLQRLHEAVRQPNAETQMAERADMMSMREALERVERAVGGTGGEGELGSFGEVLGGMKLAVNGLAAKLEDNTMHGEILAKLEAIGAALPGGTVSTLDPTLLEELKAHISSLRPPTAQMDVRQTDTLELSSKLDTISATIFTGVSQVDPSEIQKALEEIRERVQAPLDLSDVLMKLDGVSMICHSFMEGKGERKCDEETEGLKQEANEKVRSILGIKFKRMNASFFS